MSGAVEGLSRRVGRHPMRWFLGLWGSLTALWLLLGVINLRVDQLDDVAPPPEAVPYADFLDSVFFDFAIDPDRLSRFDASLQHPDHEYDARQGRTGPDQIVCSFYTTDAACGWPRPWLRWSRGVMYDVTDPTGPFGRVSQERDWVTWDGGRLSWYTVMADGSTWWEGEWRWAPTLLWSLVLEAGAAVTVVGLWAWDRTRYRRRLRRRQCVACGYDLRAQSGAGGCPECGSAAPGAPARSFPCGRAFLASCGALVVLWSLTVALTRTEAVITDIQEQLDKLEALTSERSGPMTQTIIVGERTYGWPRMFMRVWDGQAYESIAGQRPTAILDPYIRSGVASFGSYGYFRWHTRHGTIHRMTDIYWGQALVQLAGLQVVALGLVGLIAAARWLRARTPDGV